MRSAESRGARGISSTPSLPHTTSRPVGQAADPRRAARSRWRARPAGAPSNVRHAMRPSLSAIGERAVGRRREVERVAGVSADPALRGARRGWQSNHDAQAGACRRRAARPGEVGERGQRATVVELAPALRDQDCVRRSSAASRRPARAPRTLGAGAALVRGGAEIRHHARDRGERGHRGGDHAAADSGARAPRGRRRGGERALERR